MSTIEQNEIQAAVENESSSEPTRRGFLAGLSALFAGGFGLFATQADVLADDTDDDDDGAGSDDDDDGVDTDDDEHGADDDDDDDGDDDDDDDDDFGVIMDIMG